MYEYRKVLTGVSATSTSARVIEYPNWLLLVFAASVVMLVVALMLGLIGLSLESEAVTYWSIGSCVAGVVGFLYATREAKRIAS